MKYTTNNRSGLNFKTRKTLKLAVTAGAWLNSSKFDVRALSLWMNPVGLQ